MFGAVNVPAGQAFEGPKQQCRLGLWRSVALVGHPGEESGPVTSHCPSAFAGFRFPREVITVAVRWYLRYGLSYRDVEELLAERGILVEHVTVYR